MTKQLHEENRLMTNNDDRNVGKNYDGIFDRISC